MRQGTWGHPVARSRCMDWGTSGAEQVQACQTIAHKIHWDQQRLPVHKEQTSLK